MALLRLEQTTGDREPRLGWSHQFPSQSVTIVVLLTLITLAPSLLIMTTAFTRIVVVLSLTRNALGLQTIPPNQVVVGLALFLSFFVIGADVERNELQSESSRT